MTAETTGDRSSLSHWETVYATKSETQVSWFQDSPHPSSDLIARLDLDLRSPIIDVGGGASRLVDRLLEKGFCDLTVLDLSVNALAISQARLGSAAQLVRWVAADVTQWEGGKTYALWHDRAAFHFLTEPRERAAYVSRLDLALKPNGYAIIGTFAPDGPERCSGLPIIRYDPNSLAMTLGDGFALATSELSQHRTPWGSEQRFQYSVFQRS